VDKVNQIQATYDDIYNVYTTQITSVSAAPE